MMKFVASEHRRLPRSRTHATATLGLVIALVGGLFTVQSAAAQQNPLPVKEAFVVLGQPNFFSEAAGTDPNQLTDPTDVEIDPVSKKVFVADGNARVLRFASYDALVNGDDPEQIFLSKCPIGTRGQSCVGDVDNLAIDGSGRLWVNDVFNYRILRLDDAVNGSDSTADGILGAATYNIVGNTSLEEITFAGANRDLLIAHDWTNNKYLYWDTSTLPADGAAPDSEQTVPEIPGFYGLMAYDYATGGLWLQDREGDVIFYYTDPTDLSAPQGVIGQNSIAGTATGTSATLLSYSQGIWASNDGTLFVHDNGRILAFRDAATRAVAAVANTEYVAADEVWGAADFDTAGSAIVDESFTGTVNRISGDPATNAFAISIPDKNQVRIFIVPPVVEETQVIEPVCELTPDMAVTPQFIEFSADGSASLTVTMRNLCDDASYNGSDVLVSLSDGLSVSGGSAGLLILGQRGAWQGISLAPGETRSWMITIQATQPLPTNPIFVVELYHGGGVASRIDGVLLGAQVPTPAPAVEAAPAAVTAEATPVDAPALPSILPNTASGTGPLTALPVIALMVIAFGALLGLRRR